MRYDITVFSVGALELSATGEFHRTAGPHSHLPVRPVRYHIVRDPQPVRTHPIQFLEQDRHKLSRRPVLSHHTDLVLAEVLGDLLLGQIPHGVAGTLDGLNGRIHRDGAPSHLLVAHLRCGREYVQVLGDPEQVG